MCSTRTSASSEIHPGIGGFANSTTSVSFSSSSPMSSLSFQTLPGSQGSSPILPTVVPQQTRYPPSIAQYSASTDGFD